MVVKPLESISQISLESSSAFHNSQRPYEYERHYTKYNLEYFASGEDLSFAVVEADKVLALVLANCVANESLSFFNFPIGVFFDDSICGEQLLQCQSLITTSIRDLSKEKKLKSILIPSLDFLVNDFFSSDQTIHSHVVGWIDLEETEELILRRMRKSYRSLFNWGKKNLFLTIMDHENPDPEIFREIKDFHFKVAGRKTRSDLTWDLQFEAIKNRSSFVAIGRLDNHLVSATLVNTSSDQAYYGVGIYDRALMSDGLAIGHWPVLSSILHAKKIGLKEFILGNLAGNESEKERSIALFKKGFTNQLRVQNSVLCKLTEDQ